MEDLSGGVTSVRLLLATILVGALAYGSVMAIRYFLDFRRRMQYLSQFPTMKSHWLFGHVYDFPGPNQDGLNYMVFLSSFSLQGFGVTWLGPYPTEAFYHSKTIKFIMTTSGPNQEGLNYVVFLSSFIKEGWGVTWFGPYPTVALYHFKAMKFIFATSEPKPRQFGGYANVYPWLGEGLLLSGGKKWARNRRLLTPAFHFDILRPYMNVNNQATDIFLSKLEKYAASGQYFDITGHISLLTLDIILRCAFSYDIDPQRQGDSNPYVNAINRLGEAVVYRMLRPWLYPQILFYLSPVGRQFKKDCDYVHKVSEEVIQKRKVTLKTQGIESMKKSRYLDFLDVLLTAKDDSGSGLSDREIRDEVDTFMFEGHDTTSSGISWTLYSLAKHPEHQERCQQEIDELLASKQNKDIEWDDLPKLNYLTMCIKEALRMHTPVPFIQRQTTKDLEIEGRTVPAGTMIDIHLYVLHHNPLIWEDPEEFRPERFSPEKMAETDNYAFVPFSAGPRNCIGQHFAMHEMKTIIAKTLSRFTLTLDPDRKVEHRIVVVMKTENGMYMKATPRGTPESSSAPKVPALAS